MNNNAALRYKTPILLLGILFVIWGFFGWLDVGNYAQAGFATDGNHTIIQVLPGSVAERSGLQVGDYILSIDGISQEDAATVSRRQRAEVSETRVFEVQRDSEVIALDITYEAPIAQRRLAVYAAFIIGFSFLGFTLWAYMQKPSRATMVLALAGILISLAFLGGPYFANYSLRAVSNALVNILIFLSLGALLHFLLVFPRLSNLLDKPRFKWVLYALPLFTGLFTAYRIRATPPATSALNTFTNILVGVTIGGYLLLALITMLKRYFGAGGEERTSKGLNLMMIGTIIGLVPVMLSNIIGIFAPQLVLPGQQFYFMTLILIPITWSSAAMKA